MECVGSLEEVKNMHDIMFKDPEVCISVERWTKWFMSMSRLEHSWSKHRKMVPNWWREKKEKSYRGKNIRENLINYIMTRSCSPSLSKGNIAPPIPDMTDVSPFNTAAQKKGGDMATIKPPRKEKEIKRHMQHAHQRILLNPTVSSQKERYSK